MRRILVLLLPLLLLACAEHETPEQQIRQMIEQAEIAFEARSLLDAGSFLSDRYQDENKRNKQSVVRLLGGYFLRNHSIHLLVQVERIDLSSAERPTVTLYAAMAGTPLADIEALLNIRAALYRFDLELIQEEGEWRIISGRWQPATREDFLGIERQ